MLQQTNHYILDNIQVKDELLKWVEENASLMQPAAIHWVDGSQREYDGLCQLLVKKGTFIALNPEKRPNSFACFSDPSDVARVEDKTFICIRRKEDAGPTNNWMDPIEMKKKLGSVLGGSMKGRTLYVIPFCMGPLRTHYSRYGLQLTDSE